MGKKKLDGKCPYTSEKCWWKHDTNEIDPNSAINCFICNETFTSKSVMMKHRKKEHRSKVRKCTKFLQNQCPFLNESCWFLHDEDDNNKIEINNGEHSEDEQNDNGHKSTFESVFQKVQENLKPPIRKSGKSME